ncbi:hypothetical protein [Tenacibaculum sp. 190524A05c]|uniref:hypothetical protein n=1 Tax=Tenacibaculum platacis TaxID=3137852 RepID=UPI0031FA7FD6
MPQEEQNKYAYYAAILTDKVGELFDEDHDDCLDKEELSENLTDFFHALSSVMPCHLYNRFLNEQTNHLEFNHIANRLCFQFSTKE